MRLKIAILTRNPNLFTIKRLVQATVEHGHEPLVIDYSKCNVAMEKGKPSVFFQGKSLTDVHAIIPRIGASLTFFGTAMIRQFEMMNVFTANRAQAVSRSRDKLTSLQLLSKAGIGIPKTAFARFPKDKDVEELLHRVGGAPVIIKLLEGTQGLGVVLAETKKAATSVIEAFSGLQANILIQEFIKESEGADIRAFVVGGEVVAAMKREGKEGEFRSNIHRGGNGAKIELNKEEAALAVQATKILGLSVAGVDMLQSSRGPLILEVNSSPGLQGIETATQVDVAGKIIEFIERRVKERAAALPPAPSARHAARQAEPEAKPARHG